MRILTQQPKFDTNQQIKEKGPQEEKQKLFQIQDTVDIRVKDSFADKLLVLPKKLKEYTEPKYYTNQYGQTREYGDSPDVRPVGAALGGGIQGYIFGGGPVGLLSGALGGYVGTEVSRSTQSVTKGLAAGAATGAAAGVATATALSILVNGTTPGVGVLIPIAILGGLSGTTGTLSGNKFVSVQDGMYGGVTAGLVAQALTGNSAMALAGAVGGGAGGIAETTTGKLILGGGAGALAGAVTAIPALITMGANGLPILAISATAGALSGATGAVAGQVVRRFIRNVTTDASEAVSGKVDAIYAKRKPSIAEKTLAGAGIGAIMLAPLGWIFGGPQGAAIAAGVGAVAKGGLTLYQKTRDKKKYESLPHFERSKKDFEAARNETLVYIKNLTDSGLSLTDDRKEVVTLLYSKKLESAKVFEGELFKKYFGEEKEAVSEKVDSKLTPFELSEKKFKESQSELDNYADIINDLAFPVTEERAKLIEKLQANLSKAAEELEAEKKKSGVVSEQ